MFLQIKSSFLHLQLLFDHKTPLLKVQKTCVDSLKIMGIATKMDAKTKLVNTRNIQQQSQQQISQTKETLKLAGPLNNILTALQKNVKNFKGGNLRYFSKNWYEYIL